jgi:tetratricopeptide (TPR) repeat protein
MRALAAYGLVLACALTLESTAQASGKDPKAPAATAHDPAKAAADREAARAFAERGYEAFEQGDYTRAKELFEQAEFRYHAPPHWLYIARSQVKLGQIIAATATYKRVADEKLEKDAPPPFKDAIATAKSELAAVEAKIGKLTIVLTGTAAKDARVTIDGESFDSDRLGVAVPIDPGKHQIVAESAAAGRALREVTVADGGTGRAELVLNLPESGSYAPAIVFFGLGAAGLGVGAVTGALALGKDPVQESSERTTFGVVAITSLVTSGVCIGGGVIALALRPNTPKSTAIQVDFGPRAISVRGTF